ncbi:hypothetical protein UAJ10_19400 [Nitrospirillum sp. BR 11164]|uniref:hypothetical protein n=1 Tax=Nitrospirillum sp. BR 11164 TaxID=3104324 RepID=UPI002AFEF774|nr:hypothetical protein [Nitrospirillum sp. BR 11164]MEA1651179.1 hypothetical protein [Nitrospirillum sp. BR 11164]
MLTHKFKVGQNAVMRPAVRDDRPGSAAVSITRLLPVEGGEPLYHIKVDVGGQERVVRESQLAALGSAGISAPSPASLQEEMRSGAGRKKP